MSKKDEALKLALELLIAVFQGKDKTGQVPDAITAICEALAEQPAQQEPDCPKCGNNRQVLDNQITKRLPRVFQAFPTASTAKQAVGGADGARTKRS